MAKLDLDYKKLPTEVDVAYRPIGGSVGIPNERVNEINTTSDGNADLKKGSDAIDASLGIAPQAAIFIGDLTVTVEDVPETHSVTIKAKPTYSKAGESVTKTTDGVKTLKQMFSTRSFTILITGTEDDASGLIPDDSQEIALAAVGNPTGDGDGALLNHCRRRNLGYI